MDSELENLINPAKRLENAYARLMECVSNHVPAALVRNAIRQYVNARIAVEPGAIETVFYTTSSSYSGWAETVPTNKTVIVISCDRSMIFRSHLELNKEYSSKDVPMMLSYLDCKMKENARCDGKLEFIELKPYGTGVGPGGLQYPVPTHQGIKTQPSATSKPKKDDKPMTSKRTASNGAISIAELKDLLRDNLNALWENDPALHTKHADASMMIPPVMVWGAPGVGKSTAVRELTKELGIGFIDVRLAQREPVDMRGLPVPDEKENSVKWLVSGEWPRDPKSRGIIMFDELTAADKTLQVAAYEFILDRRLGALYSVPPGWYIMAAGNRTEDRAVACAMSSALANRFLHVEVAAEANSFLAWAKENNIHPAVINFIKIRPQLLFSQENEDLQRGWPSPRSWERVSTMLKIAEKNKRKTTLRHTVPGLIGIGAASEFLAFYKNMFYMSDTIDIAEALETGRAIPLPQKADLLHACCGAVAYHVKTAKDEKTFPAVAENFLKFVRSLPNDFAAMIMNDVESGLTGTRRWQLIEKHPLFETVKSKYAPNNLFNF